MSGAALIAAGLALAGVVVAAQLGARTACRAARERAARVAHEVRGPLSAAQLVLHAAARRADVPPTLVAALELELRRAAMALDDRPRPGASYDVDVADLLRCQVQTWQAVAAAHGARVVLDLDGAGVPVVHADALRLAQATANVVANAIEHGGGIVTVRTRTFGDRVRIEVTDGGRGLPAPVAELTRRPRDGRGSRGRGLAIASAAASACGGRIAALPSGGGGRVAIDLPAAGGRR